jgi:CheY-like chemotaxis protein
VGEASSPRACAPAAPAECSLARDAIVSETDGLRSRGRYLVHADAPSSVRNELGEPIAEQRENGSVAAARAQPAFAPARPLALVVDDDPEVRRAIARLLRPELDVLSAGSIARAEELLVRLERLDLAFIDWELPDGTGEQILERLAHWPDAIRVLISARVLTIENPLKNRALANLVLGKPLALGVVESLKRAALALPED